jgi:hypothetical protein
MRTTLNVEVVIDIERPASDVWAMVSDFTRLPEWIGEFDEVVSEGEAPAGQGAFFRYRLAPGPGEREGLMELVEWDPPQRLAWDGPPLRSRIGGARPRGFHQVVELGPERCRFSTHFQPELSGGLALMRFPLTRWLKRQRAVDYQRLKDLLEDRP